MKLAGDAGSLLKVDEEIASVIAEAKQKWLASLQAEQRGLFEIAGAGIVDSSFWEAAEHQIYVALREYAEQSESHRGYQRRLFAQDAARGFAYVDLCRKRYDLVLMNPPFGDCAVSTRQYVSTNYPEGSHDICAAFVLAFTSRLSRGGKLGAITTRLALFLQSFGAWRHLLFRKHHFGLVSDMGYGVLDAMVETAMYVIDERRATENADTAFLGLLSSWRWTAKYRPILRHWSGETQRPLRACRVNHWPTGFHHHS
jgi:hypothetical protein